MRDPYDVLGVSKSASAADIKSAFRKLAKKLHPDANKHDPKAASRFAELNAAHEILGDVEKRKAFDRGEIDAEGKPRFQGFEGFGGAGRPGGGFGGEGVFETFNFGPGGSQRAGGGRAAAAVASRTSSRRVPVRGGGRGGARLSVRGRETQPAHGGDVTAAVTITLAEAAKGTTRRVQLPTGKEVEVKIPAGLAEGQQIRLKGQGAAEPARASGRRADHGVGRAASAVRARWRRLAARAAGDALRGRARRQGAGADARRRGRARDPRRHQRGPHLPLKGKGFPGQDATGDLLATVRIVLPDGGDAELEELMRKWRDKRPYDPRKGMP